MIDSIFNLAKYKNIKSRKFKIDFEKDVLPIIQKLNLWEKTYILGTKILLRTRIFLQFYEESKEVKVNYQ
ncbi:hypothetical protein [Tenacibaculum sp. C7A-26P2]|uniref:hypothetical protein n=1 Tax=Tenacibaculum sp. C7A-26P2 TaxID=3447504 RepID=UPI003F878FFE